MKMKMKMKMKIIMKLTENKNENEITRNNEKKCAAVDVKFILNFKK